MHPKAVTHELRCVRCRSVLRGLPVNAPCPECATPVMVSLVETLDFPSQALARPLHARRLAAALVGIGAGALLWLVAVTAPMAARALQGFASNVPRSQDGGAVDRAAVVLACIGALAVAACAVQLCRKDDEILAEEVGPARGRLLWGAGLWAAASLCAGVGVMVDLQSLTGIANAGLWFMCLTVQLMAATVAAWGLNSYAAALGRRCRRFRHAAHARQSLEAMIVTGAVALVTSFGAAVLPSLDWPDLALLLRIVALVTGALLMVGVIYLLLNFWWISRVLLRPPPQLTDVVRIVEPSSRGEYNN